MIFAQTNPVAPMERFHGIRDRFASGGSIPDFVLALTVFLVAITILYGVMRWKMRRGQRAFYNPRKVFDQLVRSQRLHVDQRDLLRRIARDLRLEHPTVLLLSPQLLSIYGNQWMSAKQIVSESQRQQIESLSANLFEQA